MGEMQSRRSRWLDRRADLGACILLFGLTVLLQYRNGAFSSEFGNHPDEAAHYVTGLMVHDFCWSGDWSHPRSYAENYYVRYPKVALGHWPPFFYLLQAVWMSIFPLGRTSLVLFMAVLTTVVALDVYRLVRSFYGVGSGVGLGVLFLLLPPVQESSAVLMADILMALLCLHAALAFARFLDQSRWQDSCAFGLWSSMAIMTKGTGMALALLPLMALLFGRRFSLLRRWEFWLPAVLVALLCAPWYFLTLGMVHSGWFESTMSWTYSLSAIRYYSRESVVSLGAGLSVLAIIGLIARLIVPWRRGGANGVWSALGAWLVACILLLCFVPCGVDRRFLLPILPVFVLAVAAGAEQVAHFLANRIVQLSPRWLCPGLIAILFLAFSPLSSPVNSAFGYADVTDRILEQSVQRGLVLLVSSDSCGEGMLVAEMARRDRQHTHVVLRTSKVLSTSHWIGKDFNLRFATPEQLASYLDQLSVDFIVLDMSIPLKQQDPDRLQLVSCLATASPSYLLAGKYPLVRRNQFFPEGLYVYRRQSAASSSPRIIRVPMEAMLGRTLEVALP
jgi:hypothetical protein